MIRHKQRIQAVQALYMWHIQKQTGIAIDVKQLLAHDIYIPYDTGEHNTDNYLGDFARLLIVNVLENIENIDYVIAKQILNIAFIDINIACLSILRIGVYELLYTKTSTPIIIHEALQIADELSYVHLQSFINGVLDGIR